MSGMRALDPEEQFTVDVESVHGISVFTAHEVLDHQVDGNWVFDGETRLRLQRGGLGVVRPGGITICRSGLAELPDDLREHLSAVIAHHLSGPDADTRLPDSGSERPRDDEGGRAEPQPTAPMARAVFAADVHRVEETADRVMRMLTGSMSSSARSRHRLSVALDRLDAAIAEYAECAATFRAEYLAEEE